MQAVYIYLNNCINLSVYICKHLNNCRIQHTCMDPQSMQWIVKVTMHAFGAWLSFCPSVCLCLSTRLLHVTSVMFGVTQQRDLMQQDLSNEQAADKTLPPANEQQPLFYSLGGGVVGCPVPCLAVNLNLTTKRSGQPSCQNQ